jgi:hypothetical protein
MLDPNVISERPWRALDRTKPHFRTMLAPEEHKMLYWMTRNYYSGAGAIIDAGCFIGGSTMALGQGLVDSGLPGVVHSYDLFVADYNISVNHKLISQGIKEGDSTRPLFDANTAPIKDRLVVHEGDIINDPWPGDPIEILFLDVLKSTAISDSVNMAMLPALIPGRSVVIQQDYLWIGAPWIHIMMEALSEYLTLLSHTEDCSAIFLCTKKVTPEVLRPLMWTTMTWPIKLALMEAAISRWEGKQRQYLVDSKPTLMKLRPTG